MRIDALVLQLRSRSHFEAADLGVRLCQHAAPDVWRCYALVYLPCALFAAIAALQWSEWLLFVLWFLKPWFDRTILYVLSRAAFGERTTVAQWWSARRSVLWGQPWRTFVLQRLSLSRSFRQPTIQLEGLAAEPLRVRLRQLAQRRIGAARGLTASFSMIETGLSLALISLWVWFMPPGIVVEWGQLLSDETPLWYRAGSVFAGALAPLAIEPFYVAAGFGLYLNRRAELEAWDVEQELRVAFAR